MPNFLNKVPQDNQKQPNKKTIEETKKKEEPKKEEQKLLDYFDKRLTDLTTKIQTDIDSIEKIKYDYVDTVIKKFEDVEEEHKKHQAEEKTEKEKHDKEKNDKEKRKEDQLVY